MAVRHRGIGATRGARPEGKRQIKSVANGLRALILLKDHPGGAGLTDLSRGLCMPKSTLHFLLSTLAAHDFVEINRETGLYRIGLKVFEVGTAAVGHRGLGPQLSPPMERLAYESQEAVSLAVMSEDSALIVRRFESTHLLRAEIGVGTRMPLHASASGKCLLAYISREHLDRIYPDERLPDDLPSAIHSKSDLLNELSEIRQRGYATNCDEYVVGVAAVACPVRNHAGWVVAALSIAGPTARFELGKWVRPLEQTATELSELAGYT